MSQRTEYAVRMASRTDVQPNRMFDNRSIQRAQPRPDVGQRHVMQERGHRTRPDGIEIAREASGPRANEPDRSKRLVFEPCRVAESGVRLLQPRVMRLKPKVMRLEGKPGAHARASTR